MVQFTMRRDDSLTNGAGRGGDTGLPGDHAGLEGASGDCRAIGDRVRSTLPNVGRGAASKGQVGSMRLGRLVGGIGIVVGGFEAAAGGWVARGAVDVDAASKGA